MDMQAKHIYRVGKCTYTIVFVIICIIFIVGSVLVSCDAGPGEKELRVVLSGNPDTLDPHRTGATITSQVNNSIYESLFNSDGTPLLVERYEVTDGGKTWILVLRKDIVFHHKKQLHAEDVIASLFRLKEKGGETASSFAEQYAIIHDIIAEDDYTVKIELKYEHSGFKAFLSSPESVILPADLIGKGHNFNVEPVGTGPFLFQEWQQNRVIRLQKNTEYRDSVYLHKIAFIIIKDRNSQLQALYKKEVDIVPYLEKIESEQVKLNDALKVLRKSGSTILVLAMNGRHPDLSVLETRRAIAQAIDKKKVIDIAYNGGNELNVFWHRDSEFFLDVPSLYDVERSKMYFKNNPIHKTLTISVPNAFPPHVRAAEMYQKMLVEVGVSTVIEEIDWSVWLNRVYRQGMFDFTVIGHTGKLDPDLRLSNFGKGASYIGWKNDNFVSLVDKARVTTDTTLRAQLYQSALRIMTQHYPFVFIAENEVSFGVTNRVGIFEFDKILERYDFRKTQLF